MIYLLTSCNTEERIAQNIYIHNSNRIYKKINYVNHNIYLETDILHYSLFGIAGGQEIDHTLVKFIIYPLTMIAFNIYCIT